MTNFENITETFEVGHPTAKSKFGWVCLTVAEAVMRVMLSPCLVQVREMWAYSLAAALADLPHKYAEFGRPP